MISNCLIITPHDPKLNVINVGFFWSLPLKRAGVDSEIFNFDRMINQYKIYANKFFSYYTGKEFFDVYTSVERRLLNTLKKKDYDLIFFFNIKHAREELLANIRKISPKSIIINVFHDNPFFYPITLKSIHSYDYFFIKDDYVLKEMDKLGIDNCYFLMHGFSKDFHRPYSEEELSQEEKKRYTADISFIGSIYPQRQIILENLRGFDIKLWGKYIWDSVDTNSWLLKHHNSILCDDEMKSKIVSCSKINLNTHNYQNDIDGSNSRTFEICASGGFQLVDYKPVLEKYFKIGKEIEVFRSAKELRELAQFYLSNDKERRKIACAGYRRAVKEHSYDNRLKEIFKVIKK
ncbi:MAG: glycosyltransferase [Candidatus Woesearchaeota archaeon]